MRTNHELWRALCESYTDQCASNEMTLKLQFHSYSKKPNQSISEYLSGIKSIVDSLAAINCLINDKNIAIQALNGLPAKYDPLVAAITHLSMPLSFHDFWTKLLNQEQRLNQTNIPSTLDDDHALFTSATPHNRTRDQQYVEDKEDKITETRRTRSQKQYSTV